MSNHDSMLSIRTSHVNEQTYELTWTIKDFKKIEFKPDQPLKSEIISTEEFEWRLVLGVSNDDAAYLSLRIDIVSYRVEKVNVKFTAIDTDSIEHVIEFDYFGTPVGFPNFLNLQKIHRRQYLPKGKLVISGSVCFRSNYLLPSVSQVIDNFKEMLNSSKFSDVTLKVEEKEIAAHKNILSSRSSVFCAMFESNMKESDENVINIIDISYDVLKEVLTYIYTGNIASSPTYKLLVDLFFAADKYDINGFMTFCKNGISKFLNVENALEILELANRHNVEDLKDKALVFITDHAKEIIETQYFEEIDNSPQTAVFVEIIRALVSNKNNKGLKKA